MGVQTEGLSSYYQAKIEQLEIQVRGFFAGWIDFPLIEFRFKLFWVGFVGHFFQ